MRSSPTGPRAASAPPPIPARRIFTVGHSNRSLDELVEVLVDAEVRSVADARRYPRSRRYPHFDRAELGGALLRHGIAYHWLGGEIGGLVEGSYDAYVRTSAFLAGLRRLEQIAASAATAILCAERDPQECHRLRVADELADRGWEVVHLIDAGERRSHAPAERQRRLF